MLIQQREERCKGADFNMRFVPESRSDAQAQRGRAWSTRDKEGTERCQVNDWRSDLTERRMLMRKPGSPARCTPTASLAYSYLGTLRRYIHSSLPSPILTQE